jgi:hypothetical protein
MQPEYPELSTPISKTINASETSNTSQYGFLSEQLHTTDLRDPLEEEHSATSASSITANAVGSLSHDDARLQEQLHRLSFKDSTDNRPKPSFQRISEHENALSPSTTRKQSEGPGFKIITNKGNRVDGPQLDQFPNGMPLRHSAYESSPQIVV